MSTTFLVFCGIVAAVALERGLELVIANRHAAKAFEQGGVEEGMPHYRVMKLLHASFLVAGPLEVWFLDRPFIPALGIAMTAVLIGTMALRYWVIATLGWRWNTRIIVVPGLGPVTGGPYRYIRHPNYVAVVLELAVYLRALRTYESNNALVTNSQQQLFKTLSTHFKSSKDSVHVQFLECETFINNNLIIVSFIFCSICIWH